MTYITSNRFEFISTLLLVKRFYSVSHYELFSGHLSQLSRSFSEISEEFYYQFYIILVYLLHYFIWWHGVSKINLQYSSLSTYIWIYRRHHSFFFFASFIFLVYTHFDFEIIFKSFLSCKISPAWMWRVPPCLSYDFKQVLSLLLFHNFELFLGIFISFIEFLKVLEFFFFFCIAQNRIASTNRLVIFCWRKEHICGDNVQLSRKRCHQHLKFLNMPNIIIIYLKKFFFVTKYISNLQKNLSFFYIQLSIFFCYQSVIS